jgi:hypothetical protein
MVDLPRLRGDLQQALASETTDPDALAASLHTQLQALLATSAASAHDQYERQVVLACAIAALKQRSAKDADPGSTAESALLAAECLRLRRQNDQIRHRLDEALRELLAMEDGPSTERAAQARQDWRDVAELLAAFRSSARFRLGDRVARSIDALLGRSGERSRTTFDVAEEIVQRQVVTDDPPNQ